MGRRLVLVLGKRAGPKPRRSNPMLSWFWSNQVRTRWRIGAEAAHADTRPVDVHERRSAECGPFAYPLAGCSCQLCRCEECPPGAMLRPHYASFDTPARRSRFKLARFPESAFRPSSLEPFAASNTTGNAAKLRYTLWSPPEHSSPRRATPKTLAPPQSLFSRRISRPPPCGIAAKIADGPFCAPRP